MDLFATCSWKFFLRLLLGLEPIHKATPLIFGAAFHYGKAVFYATRRGAKALDAAEKAILHFKHELESGVEPEALITRVRTLLSRWITTFGQRDLLELEILGVEKEMKVPVPGLKGFFFTVRVDLLARRKSDRAIIIGETKTSSHSVKLTLDALELGDQVSAYVKVVGDKLGEPVSVLPDVAYWGKHTVDPAKIEIVRGTDLTRSKYATSQFMAGVSQRFSEISQKVAAYEEGRDPGGLFPRNTFYCTAYGRRCEYAEVCRDSRLLSGYVPPGFKTSKPFDIKRLGEETWDTSIES